MRHLEHHEGAWSGSNAFRLMPGDPQHEAPIEATVSRSAKGLLTQIAYTWTHPDDGEQQGLLVLGQGEGEDPAAVLAFWGDSWHQSPAPRTLDGALDGGVVTVAGVYFVEWGWDVVVDAATPDVLTLTMHNVIPASAATEDKAAGPYVVMHARMRRAS